MLLFPNITFIINDLMSLKEVAVFLLKRFLPMMLPLVRDVIANRLAI